MDQPGQRKRNAVTEHTDRNVPPRTNQAPTSSTVANGDVQQTTGRDGKAGSEKTTPGNNKLAVDVTKAMLPEWLSFVAMFGLISGGCCSNVFALEAIVKEAPGSGTLITCFQFVLTALFTLPSHLDVSRGFRNLYLKPRAIPFRTWIIYTAFFVTINILNNKAFHYKISVPLHIILRSAGPVATMTVQRLAGKRFESRRVAAVFLLFSGVVLAAVADARSKAADVQLMSMPGNGNSDFWIGFGILYLALMLSAVMGVYTDRTYAKYGREHSEENLFYSHTLSLPYFLSQWPELRQQTAVLLASSPSTVFIAAQPSTKLHSYFHTAMQKVPVQVLFLLINGLTQFFCIRGVNQLSAQSSSLTVSIVLNVRKLVSLILSIWLFGNKLAPGVIIGAAIVFLGGALYALPSPTKTPGKTGTETKKEL